MKLVLRWCCAGVATAALLASPALRAEEAREEPGVWTFILENDLFYNQDRNYTNGIRLEYATPPGHAPNWLLDPLKDSFLFPENAEFLATYAAGQNMYTPRDIGVFPPPADQRPYAGWLYGEVSLAGENRRRFHALKISLGVVGPASLAEQSQKFVHEIIDGVEPLGWDAQLRNEPALLIAYQRSWRMVQKELGPFDLEVMPTVGVNLGNVFTYAAGGSSLRIGWRMPDDYGAPRIQPSIPGSSYFKATQFGAYLFAGVEGRAVARNIFLDGNSFRDGPSVDKNTWIADAQVGVALVWPRARVTYTHVLRTDEFEGQEHASQFGAVSLQVAF
ncbi:MAG: lipid A deacylase LpxR family protein [Parvularculaceae bacterium]